MSKSNEKSGAIDGPTSQIAQHSTQSDALPLNRPVLLGTFGTPESPGALIRLSSGDVVKISIGQLTQIGEILGIADGEVMIVQNGRTARFGMPR